MRYPATRGSIGTRKRGTHMESIAKGLFTFISSLAMTVGLMAILDKPIQADPKGFFTQSKAVYVESHLPDDWAPNLRSTKRFIDPYLLSSIEIRRCDQVHRCIIIDNGNVQGQWTGNTRERNGATHIVVERTIPPKYRTAVLDHEFGHAFGLKDNPHCVSRMFQYVNCRGHITPRTYTRAERRILGRH